MLDDFQDDFQGVEGRIDSLIEELVPLGTFESAAMASILLACRAALRDGQITEVERMLWRFHDSFPQVRFERAESSAGQLGRADDGDLKRLGAKSTSGSSWHRRARALTPHNTD